MADPNPEKLLRRELVLKHIQGEENIVASSVETAIKRELKRKDQVVKATP
jgi:hypothetical protein